MVNKYSEIIITLIATFAIFFGAFLVLSMIGMWLNNKKMCITCSIAMIICFAIVVSLTISLH